MYRWILVTVGTSQPPIEGISTKTNLHPKLHTQTRLYEGKERKVYDVGGNIGTAASEL